MALSLNKWTLITLALMIPAAAWAGPVPADQEAQLNHEFFNLGFPHTEVALEARHYELTPDDSSLPGIQFKANTLGVRYGFSW
jgi:hypothetical protein